MSHEIWTLGLDAGSDTIKLALAKDGVVSYKGTEAIGTDQVPDVVGRVLAQAQAQMSISVKDIALAGIMGRSADFIGDHFKDIQTASYRFAAANAKGVYTIRPDVRSIVDAGADSYTILKCKDGIVLKSGRNDMCASGAGGYLKKAAKMMRLDPEQFGEVVDQYYEDALTIGSVCAVFAETEIISMVHKKYAPESILAGVYKGVATRIEQLAYKIGELEDTIAFTGGVALNKGMVKTLQRVLDRQLFIPESPQTVGACGAAVLAYEAWRGSERS